MNTWTLCSPFDGTHILFTDGVTTKIVFPEHFWMLGKSAILSDPAGLRAGTRDLDTLAGLKKAIDISPTFIFNNGANTTKTVPVTTDTV